jgi:hypothetical protein
MSRGDRPPPPTQGFEGEDPMRRPRPLTTRSTRGRTRESTGWDRACLSERAHSGASKQHPQPVARHMLEVRVRGAAPGGPPPRTAYLPRTPGGTARRSAPPGRGG